MTAQAFSRIWISIAFGIACTGRNGDDPKSAGTSSDSGSEVLASVGTDRITMANVREKVGGDLDRAEYRYQQYRSAVIEATLDSMLRDRVINLEASKQGKSYSDLVGAAAGPGGLEPSETEIGAWYSANAGRLGGRSLAELRGQIADLLRGEKKRAVESLLRQRLDKEHNVIVSFEPYRLKFDNTGAPSAGKADAPVTLVEFSDFQCPYCRLFASTLTAVEAKYGDKVRLVYRQFPIPSIHPFAIKAAEASLCANEQGKFWELHDVMFTEQQSLSVPEIKSKARNLGIDPGRFDSCLDGGRFAAQVQNDMKEGAAVGIAGTPAVFINGVELKGGAVPLETVTAAIDRELRRAGSK